MRCLHTRYWVLECVEGLSGLTFRLFYADEDIVARYPRHSRFQRRQRTFSALGREIFRSGRQENSSYWQWLERDSDHPWPCSRKHAFGYLHQRSDLDCAAFRWRGSWSVTSFHAGSLANVLVLAVKRNPTGGNCRSLSALLM